MNRKMNECSKATLYVPQRAGTIEIHSGLCSMICIPESSHVTAFENTILFKWLYVRYTAVRAQGEQRLVGRSGMLQWYPGRRNEGYTEADVDAEDGDTI
jgi:hypothetical protein